MKILRPSSEDEMIAEYLQAEIHSVRFGLDTATAMVRHEGTLDLLEAPDLSDRLQNQKRRQILSETRGWARDEKVFANFPVEVSWHIAQIEQTDLEQIVFGGSEHWRSLSGGTSTPLDLAVRMAGDLMEPHLVAVPEYRAVLEAITALSRKVQDGLTLPPPIVVHAPGRQQIVMIEGYTRMTALMLGGSAVGATIIVGHVAPTSFDRWLSTWSVPRRRLRVPAYVRSLTRGLLRRITGPNARSVPQHTSS
jgi:hypothetical protein